jgi:subtilisin family serine protease
LIDRPLPRFRTRAVVSLAAGAALAASLVRAAAPGICLDEATRGAQQRAPPAVEAYLESLGSRPFDQRSACARWAGTFSHRNQRIAANVPSSNPVPARFILFPATGIELRDLAEWLAENAPVRDVEIANRLLIATFPRRVETRKLRELLLDSPQIQYVEPDCDGPDFTTTSKELVPAVGSAKNCWQRAARTTFPNDPCIDELWGHSMIGWDSGVAARSLPRLVAVLDSGIDARHEDLANGVLVSYKSNQPRRSQGRRLNVLCGTTGRCYPHGTEMAGTIAGRMDNGIGVAGVAPNSRLLPIVISRVEHGTLGSLSTIARAIDAAALGNADVINISAKWPVDSRAISASVRAAIGGSAEKRRLIVTGYATSLDTDESVREYFPSQYRCLPGVIAAVPADMRGRELFNSPHPQNANDGRIQAPGVDIVVTTTENSERGYALSGAAGASSAAAYVSGAVALAWGSPPLNTCDAQQIKQLLFCRSKSSNSTRYPWINVDFLRELANVGPGADCKVAMETLGCN